MGRLLTIAIDGAEATLIYKWAQDGILPTIRRLIEQGGYASLDSYAHHLPGSNWFNFYLGQQPGQHGLYSYLSWRPEKMKAEPPSQKWISIKAFWHYLKEGGARGVVLNVPDAFMLRKFNGIEVLALSNDHALTPMSSYPPHVAKEIRQAHGNMSFLEEKYDLLSFKEFLDIRDELITLTYKLRDVYRDFIKKEQWDFFLAVFPTLHRAGHRLWSTHNIYDLQTVEQKAEAEAALHQVYAAFDGVLAELLNEIHEDDMFSLVSFYGMEFNRSREVILPEMLRRVLHIDRMETSTKELLSFARNLIPLSVRHFVKSSLPSNLRYWLTSFWRLGQLDWANTRAFIMPLEINIGVRINLKGREKLGIVESGTEYETLCKHIMDGLYSFVDADTGRPLVKNLYMARDFFEGECVDRLPDILGTWNDTPAWEHRMISSPLYGEIPWPTPGKNPEGRSGNHNARGFFIAHGRSVQKGEFPAVHILDLAPTIMYMLGEPIPPGMKGKIIPWLKQN